MRNTLRPERVDFVCPKAVLSRLDALAEILLAKAAELCERMSDEGVPSPIYSEIRALIARHIAQIRP